MYVIIDSMPLILPYITVTIVVKPACIYQANYKLEQNIILQQHYFSGILFFYFTGVEIKCKKDLMGHDRFVSQPG